MSHTEQHIPDTAALTDHDQIGLEFGLSPVDLPDDTANDEGGMRWMVTLLAVSSLLLVMFNSFAIDKWARQLETTATTGPIKDAAAQWHSAMQGFGLDVPLETGRALWRDAKAARFGEGENDPAQEAAPETE
jgi:hypothetical protein